MFLQKYQVKPIPLEEAVKLIQIAERARQGRLRAMFMKQIYLQEYRAKQARLLSDKVADAGAAALRIQKVWPGQPRTCGTRWRCRRGGGELQNSTFPSPTSSRRVELTVLVAQSCPTLCDPMDCSPPGSSVHGILQATTLELGCHVLLQGIFPTQGSNPGLLHCRQIIYGLSHQRSLW